MPARKHKQTLGGLAKLARRLRILLAWVAIASLPWTDCIASDDSVKNLVQQLDSSRYSDREDATQKLARMGSPAIEPLASEYFSSSPESAWRIKKVLEQIGTQTDNEATSVKAIGILIVLDHQLVDSVTELLEKWRVNRSKRALQFLISKGAEVAAFKPRGGDNWLIFQQSTIQRDSIQSDVPVAPTTPSRAELKQQIAEIIDGTFEENQEFVWKAYAKFRPREYERNRRQRPVIVQGRQVWINANGGFEDMARQSGQLTLEFGDNWQGTPEDFKRIEELHDLSGLVFKNRMIEPSETSILKSISSLQYLGFSNARVRGKRLTSISLPANVKSIELANMTIDAYLIKWLSSSEITSMFIDNCKIEGTAVNEFSQLSQVSYLDLKRVKVSAALVNKLAKLSRLNSLVMSVCKFDVDDYQQFRAQKPQVRVYFQPVAFLGVQGSLTPNGDPFSNDSIGCKISMVVPDSAAARGGIQIDDIIEQVNGNPIEKFEDLRMYISQFEVNDPMRLQILRDGKRLDLEVTLGDIAEADLR